MIRFGPPRLTPGSSFWEGMRTTSIFQGASCGRRCIRAQARGAFSHLPHHRRGTAWLQRRSVGSFDECMRPTDTGQARRHWVRLDHGSPNPPQRAAQDFDTSPARLIGAARRPLLRPRSGQLGTLNSGVNDRRSAGLLACHRLHCGHPLRGSAPDDGCPSTGSAPVGTQPPVRRTGSTPQEPHRRRHRAHTGAVGPRRPVMVSRADSAQIAVMVQPPPEANPSTAKRARLTAWPGCRRRWRCVRALAATCHGLVHRTR